MTKKKKDRVEVRPKGRQGFELALFINGREVLVSTENYRSKKTVRRGASRLAKAVSWPFAPTFNAYDGDERLPV